jgi:hypothetical protein
MQVEMCNHSIHELLAPLNSVVIFSNDKHHDPPGIISFRILGESCVSIFTSAEKNCINAKLLLHFRIVIKQFEPWSNVCFFILVELLEIHGCNSSRMSFTNQPMTIVFLHVLHEIR